MVHRLGALGAGLGVGLLLAVACGDGTTTVDPSDGEIPGHPVGNEVPWPGPSPADGGTSPDAGVDPGTSGGGPWPLEELVNYTQRFGLGTPQSVGLDEGLNFWLLDGNRIGVLRPGDSSATWTSGVGQAREPFGPQSLAMGSTVICGGEAGRAYVGYSAQEMQRAEGITQRTYIPGPGEANYSAERYAEYFKGDLDAVRLQPDGTVALEEHLWRTVGDSNAGKQLGIHNTNDFHYEEDRSILNCARVTRGPFRGDLYVTTNHGVTRIRGLTYNSHRHPGWYLYTDDSEYGSLQCPPMHGLGISAGGDVLVANEQMVGVLVPSAKLEDWDRENTWDGPTPWTFKGFNPSINDQASDDLWRAFEQTISGPYYLGSQSYGLWQMIPTSRSSATWTHVEGLPASAVLALKATDDGALYIGTDGAGLWRLEPDGASLSRVLQISAPRVQQLVYEPTVTPKMLLVLTDQGLWVIRGR
jgi:hypothetical protein